MLSADLLNTLEIGDDFQDCNDCPVMVVIPPGAYVMGSPEMDTETESDELPQHEVILRRAFAVSQFEVTRAQFSAFILATKRSMAIDCRGHGVDPSVGLNWQSPGFTQTDTHPIVCVNWRDAKDYTEWLSAQTGFHYRLLSESEWEYAARAGANTTRYWGASAEDG